MLKACRSFKFWIVVLAHYGTTVFVSSAKGVCKCQVENSLLFFFKLFFYFFLSYCFWHLSKLLHPTAGLINIVLTFVLTLVWKQHTNAKEKTSQDFREKKKLKK